MGRRYGLSRVRIGAQSLRNSRSNQDSSRLLVPATCHKPKANSGGALLTDLAIYSFTEKVGVAGMAGVSLDHVGD